MPQPVNLLPLIWFKNYFEQHFKEWIFGPIDRLVKSQDALVSFILMSCAIDYLASFWWGEETKGHVKEAYTGFTDKYFPPGKYDSLELYESLRNGLVHLFTIKNKKYALTHNHPELHLKVDTNNQVILNASDFRDDLWMAMNNYFNDVEATPGLQDKAMMRYERDSFLDLGKSEVKK